MTDSSTKRYRFAPLDRTGVLLGLSGAQCAILGATLVAGAAVLPRSPIAALLALGAGVVAAFAMWSGEPAHQHLVTRTAWHVRLVRRRTSWTSPNPWAGRSAALALPPTFGRLRVLSGSHAAVVEDRRDGSLTILMPVLGHPLELLDPSEQDRMLAGWGDVLATVTTSGSPVIRLTVSEWAGPAARLDTTVDPDEDGAAADDYRQLVAAAGPVSRRHETLLALTVRPPNRKAGDRLHLALEHASLIATRLEQVGLQTGPALSTTALAQSLRNRLDTNRRGARSLRTAGPIAQRAEWDHVQVDRGLQATYWVAEWPRLPVAPSWLEGFLLSGNAQRTFTIVFEPVTAGEASRRIRRDATRLTADRAQRERSGWRVDARHSRAEAEVDQLEADLAAGHAQLTYVGLLAVAAADERALDDACRSVENAAAGVGIELRRLDGQHDQALPAALGILGRPVPAPRFR